MLKRELKDIEDLKNMLINNGHTEHAPLQIAQNIMLFYRLNQPEIGDILGRIEAKYLYIKSDTLFVADSKFDEVAVDCIESQSIDTLLVTLRDY